MIDQLPAAARYLTRPSRAARLLAEARWPRGPRCPSCRSRRIASGRCRDCRAPFDPARGTIYESRIPLAAWIVATWCVANCDEQITAGQLAAVIHVAPAVAGRMLARIRRAVGSN